MLYKTRIHETRTYVFDEVQKQKSAIVRMVLDTIEDINPNIDDDSINRIRRTLFKEIDTLHTLINGEKEI